MTSLTAPCMRSPLSGMANSSRPDRMRSRPPQKGRLRRQARQRSRRAGRRRACAPPAGPGNGSGTAPAWSAAIVSAAPAKAEAEAGQGERAGRGVPGVLDEVVDRDRVRFLAEGARGPAERARVLADAEVVEDRRACRLVVGVVGQVR